MREDIHAENALHMRARLIAFGALLLAGCATQPPATLDAPPFKTVVTVKQLMEWVIDPAADIVWDSVKSIMTEGGTKEIEPRTEGEWAAVRDAAATVAESGNLLMMQGRARGGKEWMAAAQRLSDTGSRALKAAEARDVTALFDAGGEIYNACSACHRRFAAHLSK